MILIAHRGNMNGPNEYENGQKYCEEAIAQGFNIELDVWYTDTWWTGHDRPQYKISWNWISKRQNNLWIHCKNVEAAKTCQVFQSFCHSSDPYSYTSNGKIWLHDLEKTFDQSTIIPLLDWEMVDSFKTHIENEVPYGICTDYPYMLP